MSAKTKHKPRPVNAGNGNRRQRRAVAKTPPSILIELSAKPMIRVRGGIAADSVPVILRRVAMLAERSLLTGKSQPESGE